MHLDQQSTTIAALFAGSDAMAIRKAFLQEQGGGKLIHEMKLLADELPRRGIPVGLFTEKKLLRRQLSLDGETLVAGQMPCVLAAMTQLGIPQPEPDDYPPCLERLLNRSVWKTTLAQVEQSFLSDRGAPVFVKPAARRKRFTGFIVETASDLWRCEEASRKDPVWCSSVVVWRSEYRVYVIRSQRVGVDHYSGDLSALLDLEVVDEAIRTLEVNHVAQAAYAIDFGVLSTGATALVEKNDGFSIGAYQIGAPLYTDFTLARWEELLAQRLSP